MLNNMKVMFSSYLTSVASNQVDIWGVCKRVDGSNLPYFTPKQLITLHLGIGNMSSLTQGTTFVFSSETQVITDDMYKMTGQIDKLAYMSSSVGSASNNYIYNLTMLLANNTNENIVIKSIGLYSKGVLLDCFNVETITLKPSGKLTVDYHM